MAYKYQPSNSTVRSAVSMAETHVKFDPTLNDLLNVYLNRLEELEVKFVLLRVDDESYPETQSEILRLKEIIHDITKQRELMLNQPTPSLHSERLYHSPNNEFMSDTSTFPDPFLFCESNVLVSSTPKKFNDSSFSNEALPVKGVNLLDNSCPLLERGGQNLCTSPNSHALSNSEENLENIQRRFNYLMRKIDESVADLPNETFQSIPDHGQYTLINPTSPKFPETPENLLLNTQPDLNKIPLPVNHYQVNSSNYTNSPIDLNNHSSTSVPFTLPTNFNLKQEVATNRNELSHIPYSQSLKLPEKPKANFDASIDQKTKILIPPSNFPSTHYDAHSNYDYPYSQSSKLPNKGPNGYSSPDLTCIPNLYPQPSKLANEKPNVVPGFPGHEMHDTPSKLVTMPNTMINEQIVPPVSFPPNVGTVPVTTTTTNGNPLHSSPYSQYPQMPQYPFSPIFQVNNIPPPNSVHVNSSLGNSTLFIGT